MLTEKRYGESNHCRPEQRMDELYVGKIVLVVNPRER